MKQQIKVRQLNEVDIMQQREFFIRQEFSTNYREVGNYFIPPNIGQMIEYAGKLRTLQAMVLWIFGKDLCNTLWNICKNKLNNRGAYEI